MPYKLIIRYALFALIATVANIGAQDIIIRSYNGSLNILLAVIVGTALGLLVKYILDKRFIFRFRANTGVYDTKTFILYAGTGLATTFIFWSFEFSFQLIFATKEMRYLGGVIGLAVGYLIKYQLDKRYVFHSEAA